MHTVAPLPDLRPQATHKRRDIQGLRAVAVLLVVANHLVGYPRGGFVGVDVFFVLSGYLITGLLVREGARSGTISLREFYARRVRRIMPVAVLVLVATNLAATRLFSAVRLHQTQADSLWALLFSANVHFSAVGTDYFQQHRPPSAVQHFWSLSVEEQFYAVWPLLLIAAFPLTRRWRLAPNTIVLPLALVGSALSFAWCLHLTAVNPAAAYFSTPGRAWELGVGAGLAIGQPHLSRLATTLRASASWVGAVGMAVAAFTYSQSTVFPGYHALLPVLATGLILAADDPRGGIGRTALLASRAPQYLGNISYSLYLWHFPCIILATAYFGSANPAFYVAAGVLPLVLASGSYHLLEEPIRRSTWLSRRASPAPERPRSPLDRPRHLTRLAAGLAVVALASSATLLVADRLARTSADPTAATGPLGDAGLRGDGDVTVQRALQTTGWGDLTPSPETLNEAVAPQWRPDNCLYIRTEADSVRCTYGPGSSRRTVAVVGDSVATSWLPGLLKAFPGWRFRLLTRGECPQVDADTFQNETARSGPNQACAAHRTWVLAQLAVLRPDMIIDAGLSETYVKLMVDGATQPAANQSRWEQATARTFQALKATTAGPVFFLAAPPKGANLQECLTPRSHPTDCITAPSASWRETSATEQRAARDTGVTYVDPLRWLCSAGRCPSVIEQHIVSADGTHLTRQMSEFLAPHLLRALTPARG